jgi:hypothetical protein
MEKKGWCKFYSLSNDYHVEAIENAFWYSTPPQYFNDIADCNSELLDFINIHREYESFVPLKNRVDRKAQRQIAVNENRKLINDCLGATCFTPYENVLNHLMWAHYAEQHKGICLHFGEIKPSNQVDFIDSGIGIKLPFNIGQKFLPVKYKRRYTKLTKVERLFTEKKYCWKYEKEQRLIQVSPKELSDNQRKIKFEKNNVLSIILGKRFKANDNYQTILQTIKREYPHALLYQVGLKPKSFNLVLEKVVIQEYNEMHKMYEIEKMIKN